ncbi:unnamed protein product [Mytilus edulis]|uniref:THAP-type domain-containing protein n=1 Tax=Mytilus edulis TaxID=6550 RepID=A0A8S3QZ96_MYTED|nr:unnamed protein product [Mytilus edulis]
MKDVFFIPFPKPITQREKCERWIKACGRLQEDFNVDKIKRCTYMCSKHFVGGKGPTDIHPDPMPALLHNDEQLRRFKRKRKAPTPRSKPIKVSKKDVSTAAECLLQLSNQLVPEHESSSSVSLDPDESIVACTENMTVGCEKGIQTDSVSTEHKEVQTIYEKNFLNAKIENMLLKNEIKLTRLDDKCDSAKSTPLSLHSIKDDDVKMKLFTGLYYDQFLALIEFLGESVNNLTYWDGKNTKENSKKGTRKFSPEEELFLTLVRFRRGYSVDTMAHFFGISSSSVSVIFTTWMQLLYCHFNSYRSIMFPERHHFRNNLPRVFKTFKNIRCTIDCTEFFVQMPRDFRRQGNLYSSYKNHHTYKSLIGVAPNGAIVYVSDLFEGSISDRAIIEQSGFLNYINPGDLILADRGSPLKTY